MLEALAPLALMLGLVSGAVVPGLLYAAHIRRNDRND